MVSVLRLVRVSAESGITDLNVMPSVDGFHGNPRVAMVVSFVTSYSSTSFDLFGIPRSNPRLFAAHFLG